MLQAYWSAAISWLQADRSPPVSICSLTVLNSSTCDFVCCCCYCYDSVLLRSFCPHLLAVEIDLYTSQRRHNLCTYQRCFWCAELFTEWFVQLQFKLRTENWNMFCQKKYYFQGRVTYNGNEKSRLVATVKQHVSCEFLSIHRICDHI